MKIIINVQKIKGVLLTSTLTQQKLCGSFVLPVVTTYILVGDYRLFGRTCCLHLQGYINSTQYRSRISINIEDTQQC
jgi:hypothetical protein